MKQLRLLIGVPVLLFTASLAFSAYASAPLEGRAGRAEMRFLEGMIDHHQMALDMANDCLANASTESVLTLCQNIIDAQNAEITTMQGWLLDWCNVDYKPMAMADMAELMGDTPEHNMEGMPATDPAMMMGMMAGLNRLEGVEYEIAFLEAMIDHHDDAIHMSQRILEPAPDGTAHTELREMAQKIIDDQTAEIAEMEEMLVELAA